MVPIPGLSNFSRRCLAPCSSTGPRYVLARRSTHRSIRIEVSPTTLPPAVCFMQLHKVASASSAPTMLIKLCEPAQISSPLEVRSASMPDRMRIKKLVAGSPFSNASRSTGISCSKYVLNVIARSAMVTLNCSVLTPSRRGGINTRLFIHVDSAFSA